MPFGSRSWWCRSSSSTASDHLADPGGELPRLQFRVLLEHRGDEIDAERQVKALVAHDPVDERHEVAQQVPRVFSPTKGAPLGLGATLAQ